MADQDPKAQAQADDELSPEDLEGAAGGLSSTNGSGCNENCPCAA
jgi:hypothetical protein